MIARSKTRDIYPPRTRNPFAAPSAPFLRRSKHADLLTQEFLIAYLQMFIES